MLLSLIVLSHSHFARYLAGAVCYECLAGTYKPTMGCTYCDNTTRDCLLCPAGSYSSALGRTSDGCDTCGGGTFAMSGSSACTTCGNGSYALNGSSACTECPLGYYALAGSTACSACPGGTYLNVGGKGSVTNCLACPVRHIARVSALLFFKTGQSLI